MATDEYIKDHKVITEQRDRSVVKKEVRRSAARRHNLSCDMGSWFAAM